LREQRSIFFAAQNSCRRKNHRNSEVILRRENLILLQGIRRSLFEFGAQPVRRLSAQSFENSQQQEEGTMEQGQIAFTAVYLKANNGYVGFIEELPGVNSHGRTLDEARDTLRKLAAVVFDEERRGAEEMIAGKDVVRESFTVPIPRVS
jgi:predicted RNase H-like HicB family nuclease